MIRKMISRAVAPVLANALFPGALDLGDELFEMFVQMVDGFHFVSAAACAPIPSLERRLALVADDLVMSRRRMILRWRRSADITRPA